MDEQNTEVKNTPDEDPKIIEYRAKILALSDEYGYDLNPQIIITKRNVPEVLPNSETENTITDNISNE